MKKGGIGMKNEPSMWYRPLWSPVSMVILIIIAIVVILKMVGVI